MPSRLDQIVDDFEAAWVAGERPSLASFLDSVDQQQQGELLTRLLSIDIHWRIRTGDSVIGTDYSTLGLQAVELAGAKLRTLDTAFESSAPGASRKIGPYKLLQQIGEGGMGTVWMAEQEKPVHRRVALKLVRDDIGSNEAIARFEAERQALAMMDHHNIAKVYDAGTTDAGSPYFVMELVKGIPITEYCDQNKLSIRQRLGLMVSVCHAVQHAHQKGIIHRDIKPSNVLVTLHDGEPVPKVIDFGLAKALEHQTKLTDRTMFTQFGQVVGTVQYMSPEQAQMDGMDVDTRSDVYSLGVMLYELLTSSTPLEKATVGQKALLQVLQIIREQDPPRPSHRLSSSGNAIAQISDQRRIAPSKLQQILRGELDWIVMKSLEKDRTRRYESANSMADDIERYLNDEAIEARPPSRSYLARKFVRKNRAAVGVVSGIAASLLLGLVGMTWLAIVANNQRERAELQEHRTAEGLERERKAYNDAVETLKREQRASNEAQQNLELALKQEQKADAAFQQARKAVDEFYTRVSESQLANIPAAQGLRQELLNEAESYYQQFLESHSEDPTILVELAAAQFRIAQINAGKDILSASKTVTSTVAGLDILEQLLEADPGPENWGSFDAGIYRGRLRLDLNDEGGRLPFPVAFGILPMADRACNTWEMLLEQKPESAGMKNDLAGLYNIRALLHDSTKQSEKAIESFHQAIEIWEKLAEDDPQSANYQMDLATAHANIGSVHRARGKIEQAIESNLKALKIQKDLKPDRAGSIVSIDLAGTLRILGMLHEQAGKKQIAEEYYKEAVDEFKQYRSGFDSQAEFLDDVEAKIEKLGSGTSDP